MYERIRPEYEFRVGKILKALAEVAGSPSSSLRRVGVGIHGDYVEVWHESVAGRDMNPTTVGCSMSCT